MSLHPFEQTGVTLDQAYDLCEKLTNTHYENFSIASWFLPRAKRRYLYSIYAFCRHVDDIGDVYKGDRLIELDIWQNDFLKCYGGEPTHPYLIALQDTISKFGIPEDPFLKLIEANRMDQKENRYVSYADLEDYCLHSAEPVGQLVLYVFGYQDHERQALSDYTCRALQLTNFWQDVSRDLSNGRIYIPLEDMKQFGYSEKDLKDRILDRRFRDLMRFQVGRARNLFRMGTPLVDMVHDDFKLDLILFTRGGLKILDAIEDLDYDVLNNRPVISTFKKVSLMLGTFIKLRIIGRFV